jgi:hypothetical protein
MLNSFDHLAVKEIRARSCFLGNNLEQDYLLYPGFHRNRIFQTLSELLRIAYNQRVIVLIDEYDSPMHVAIENGYGNSVWSFIPSPFERDSSHYRPAGSLRRSLVHCSRFVGSSSTQEVMLSSANCRVIALYVQV